MNTRGEWWTTARLPVFALALIYLAVASFAPLAAASMLYYPNYGSRRAPEGMVTIAGANGEHVAALYLPNPSATHTLWFFHGNAEDLGDIEPTLRAIRDMGFAVFAHDYPGYGASSGKPSERSLYASARVARTYLRKTLNVPAERTLLYGRSLGGGPAVQMATEERVAGLVLQSTFVSAFRVVTRWPILPFDPFRNLAKIDRIHCPLLVMHGQADEVVPFWHGEKLFAAAREPKRHFWVPAARHNDFGSAAGPGYAQALREFSAFCASRAGSTP